MVFKKTKNYLKKQAKRAGKAVVKRYWDKGPNLGNITKDVMLLKSIINAEKKHDINTVNTQLVGQVNENGGAYLIYDMTPNPVHSFTSEGRMGNSIKLMSAYCRFQLWGQGNNQKQTTIRYHLVEVKGRPYTTIADAATDFLDNSPFVTGSTSAILDNFSKRNQSRYSNFRVHRTGKIKLDRREVAGSTTTQTHVLKHRYNKGKGHHIKWAINSTDLTSGQIFLLITTDNGNTHATNVSTCGGIVESAAATGVAVNYTMNQYYFDN